MSKPYTLETHGTADLYHDSTSQCCQNSWGSISCPSNHTPYGVWKDESLCQGVWRIDTVVVPFIRTRIMVQIPYSRKLSREKTFVNFVTLWLFTKVFSVTIVSFTNWQKFSFSKVSRYTIYIIYILKKGPVSNTCPPPYHHFNFLQRSKVYSKKRPTNWPPAESFQIQHDARLVYSYTENDVI